MKEKKPEPRQLKMKTPEKKTPAPPAPKPVSAAGQNVNQNGGIKFNERAEVMEVEKNKVESER